MIVTKEKGWVMQEKEKMLKKLDELVAEGRRFYDIEEITLHVTLLKRQKYLADCQRAARNSVQVVRSTTSLIPASEMLDSGVAGEYSRMVFGQSNVA